MPKFIVTAPDGKEYEITAPEGASQEAVLEYAKQNYKPAAPTQTEGFSLSRMVGNIPSSLAEYAGSMVAPFTQPGEFVTGLGNLAKGTASKLVSGGLPEERYPEAVAQMYKERYGSIPQTLKTLESDPVGMVGDVATLLTGGGMAASKVPSVVGKAGQAVARAGAAIDPLNLAVNTAQYGVGKLTPASTPIGMYESAAKFSTTLPPKEREAMARTALQEQIMPTSKGVDKLNTILTTLDNDVTAMIENATTSGTKIKRSDMFKYVNDVRNNLKDYKIESAADRAIVNDIMKNYVKELDKAGKKEFTPMELQDIKRDIYKRVDYKRNLQTDYPIAQEELYKAIARGAKEGVESAVPEVKDINKRMGALVNLKEPLTRAAGRIENRDMIGIGVPIKATLGSGVGGLPGAALGALQGIVDAPRPKAAAALKLYDLQQRGGGVMLDNNTRNAFIRQILAESGQAMPGLLSLE